MTAVFPPAQTPSQRFNPGNADHFRAKFLNGCSLVELWMGDILARTGEDTGRIQLLSARLCELQKLAAKEHSPLKEPETVKKLLKRFQPFAELRVALAHGALRVLEAQDGTLHWAFEVHCSSTAGWKSIVLPAAQKKSILGELDRLVNELTQQSLKSA